MPSNLLGLLLFVVLLLPGFAFLTRRERFTPALHYSAFREVATIGIVSISCNAAALTVFGLIRMGSASLTPDVGALVRSDRGTYVTDHYRTVGGWAALVLLLATMIGAFAGTPPQRALSWDRLRRTPLRGWLERFDGQPIEPVSAWTRVFHREVRNVLVSVSCELVDDTVVEGLLVYANSSVDETGDRSLVLGQPARIRRGDSAWTEWGPSFVVMSAAQIRFMGVGYWDSEELWRASWASTA